MAPPNHIEIYRHLKKTNCGYCQVRTCMAFALAVARGDRALAECPHIDAAVADELGGGGPRGTDANRDNVEALVGPLRNEVARVDLAGVAGGLGGEVRGEQLCLTCLGKEFRIGNDGTVTSEVHVNPWITVPLLRYILTGGTGETRGADETSGMGGAGGTGGTWISFDELSTGTIRGQYFTRRCEEPIRHLLEEHEELFASLMEMFSAVTVKDASADRAWVLYPLPKVPFFMLYWRGDDEFPSKLRILVDRRAETFLEPESIYRLGRGIVEMLERIVARHKGSGKRGQIRT